jgi:hypothetical protein
MWVYHTPKLVSKNTCPEKDVDTPTKKQSSAHIVVKVIGERGRVTFCPECPLSPKCSIALKCDRSYSCRMVRLCSEVLVHPWAHGEGAIDHPRMCDRLLPQ